LLTQVAHVPHEEPDIALLLANGRCRRMLSRACQVHAVVRTLNLDEALGTAADGADLFTEGRAAAAPAPDFAEGTQHRAILYN
jgi:hypothetical protein